MNDFAVTAIGRDRPGIVATISRALLDLDGNIEDSQMSILRSHFAVMLVVHVPETVGDDRLADMLGDVRDELGLEAITFNPLEEVEAPPPPPSHVLTVYGADHPGIVAAMSATLAELDVNITDLETRVGGGPGEPLYMMVMEVALGAAQPDAIERAVRDTGERTGVDVSLRELESDQL